MKSMMREYTKKLVLSAFLCLFIIVMSTINLNAMVPAQKTDQGKITISNARQAELLSELDLANRFNMGYPLININYGNEYSFQNNAWTNFLKTYGTGWRVMWDARAGRPNLIEGKGIPFYAGKGNTLSKDYEILTVEYLEKKIFDFVNSNMDLLRIDLASFQLNKEGSHIFDNGRYAVIQYDYYMSNYERALKVEGGRVFFRFNNGNLIQFGSMGISDTKIPLVPSISQHQAEDNVIIAFGEEASLRMVQKIRSTELRIVPEIPAGTDTYSPYKGKESEGIAYRLIYSVIFEWGNDYEVYEAWVDAHTGKVLFYKTLTLTGAVKGNISMKPGSRRTKLFPYCSVENNSSKQTNYWSYYSYSNSPSADATSTLNGAFVTADDKCGDISLTVSASPGDLNFGSSSGTDCDTPGTGGAGNTYAARSAFWHATQVRTMAKFYLPGITWLDNLLECSTNRTDPSYPCNAYWDDTKLNFEVETADCNNTGEVGGVIYHEWGHGLDQNDGSPGKNPGTDKASGEAYGDFMCALMVRDACIAQGFHKFDACNHCPADCLGVRYIAMRFDDDDNPATPDVPVRPNNLENNAGPNCDFYGCPYALYAGIMGYEGHCESYISSGALWDAAYNIAEARGDAGWIIAERLWFESLSSMGSAFQITAGGQCNPDASVDGCAASNWYTVMIGVDDDNGNPTDGTPHGSYIWNAFNAHGIACGGNPGNHDICQQPGKPVLSVAGSNEQLALSWTPVEHATGYRIFVNLNGTMSNCNAEDWIPVADTDNVNYYVETNMPNAYSYGFAVQAINGNNNCVSDLSDCVFGGPAANSKVNLTGKKSLDWDDILIPSDNSCDTNHCTRSASLSANGSSSKINFKVYNNTTFDAGAHTHRFYVDDVEMLSWDRSSLSGNSIAVFTNQSVSLNGGRHLLKIFMDADNDLDESVETDNKYIAPAVYEPYDLDADPDHMISHSPPPDRNPEGYSYYSCDGYQFSVQPASGQNYWGAVGLLPTSSSSNYDLHLHNDYTGSIHGFENYVIQSNSGGNGEIEIIGINRRQSGITTWWAGAVQASDTPYTSTYSIHKALSGSPINVPNTGSSGSIPASAVVAIKEIYADSSDIGTYWRFSVTPSGGDIGLALIDRTNEYFSLESAITGTRVNNAGTDGLEYFDFKPAVSGYYGLLIYKPDSSELIHAINYNLAIEPSPSNLTSYAHSGWTAPLVPRSSTGCTLNSCLVTATLPGGTGTTYVNSTNINEGPLDINTGFQIRYLLDDTTLEEGTFTSLDANEIALDYDNPLIPSIKGGRHTLGMFIDANNNYSESNETDNTYYAQYVWSPKLLSDNIPYSSSAPPDRDTAGAADYNCDGYAFVVEHDEDEKYWGAVAILPSSSSANFDLRLHDDYTGATHGFETVLKSSNSSIAGGVEIIGANRNNSSTINWFAGVIQGSTTPSTSTYTICKDSSGIKVPVPVTGRAGSISANGIVAIEEIFIDNTDENRKFRFTVTPAGGDIGIALINYSAAYFQLDDAIPGTKVNGGGTNVAEQFDFIPTHYGYYALLIYKPDYSELVNAIDYTIDITELLPNLKPYTHSGWTGPVVPRDIGGCTADSCSLTSKLHGWGPGNEMNSSTMNDSIVDINSSFVIRYTIDDIQFKDVTVNSLPQNDTFQDIDNYIGYTLRGGRHTLGVIADADNVIDESNENDNTHYSQYVFSPSELNANPRQAITTGPGDRDSTGHGSYYNCDGFEFDVYKSGGAGNWGVVGLMPDTGTANYDLRLYDDYTGSTQGFANYLKWSTFSGTGGVEIVGVNRNIATTPTWWAGVIQGTDTASSDPYHISLDISNDTINVPSSGNSNVLDRVANIEEIAIETTDLNTKYRFTVTPTGGDIGIALIDQSMAYFKLSDAIVIVNNGGSGVPEFFDYTPTAAGMYGLLIYKPTYDQVPNSINYTIDIAPAPGNLKPESHTGWTAPIVPRDSIGCSESSCSPSATLNGWIGYTYVNSTILNEGTSDINTSFKIRYTLDDTTMDEHSYGSLAAGATGFDINNPFPSFIKGGLHTLGLIADADNDYSETNENDNTYYMQYVWSPKLLTDNVPLTETAPPDRNSTGYHNYNCDGYEFTVQPSGGQGFWGVVGILPEIMINYDLRLHDDYTGSTQGFQNYLSWSNSTLLGGVEIIGVNRNRTNTSTWYAGVIQGYDSPSASNYTIYKDASGAHIDVPSSGNTGSIPTNGIVAIEEIAITATDLNQILRFTVTPSGGNIAIALIDYSAAYFRLTDAIAGTMTDNGGTNEAETFEYKPTIGGMYGLLIYKRYYTELPNNINYAIDITIVSSNLKPETHTNWSAPAVPRDSTGCTQTSCLVSATLPGWTGTTYINSTTLNEGPSDVTHTITILYTLDDIALNDHTFSSILAGATAYDLNNQFAANIKGGRHTLGMLVDSENDYSESNENDNDSYNQFVWSPMNISTNTGYQSTAPPDRDSTGFTHFNSDGYQFTIGGAIGAFAVTPRSPVNNYDLRLFNDYTGSLNGFGTPVKSSVNNLSFTDFILVNSVIAGNGPWYAGVIQSSGTPQNGDYGVSYRDNFPIVSPPGAFGPYGISTSVIANVHLLNIPLTTILKIKINIFLGDADLAMAIYSTDVAYHNEADYLPGTFVNNGGAGEDEYLNVTLAPGNYIIAVFKPHSISYVNSSNTSYNLIFTGGALAETPDNNRVPGTPLTITKQPSNDLLLSWGHSCDYAAGITRYAIYRGTIASLLSGIYDHEPLTCNSGGNTTATIPAGLLSFYYLIVPTDTFDEGGYGYTSTGSNRPASASPCYPQNRKICP